MPNRTSVQVGAGTAVTTSFNNANRPTSDSAGGTYTSDDDGSLTARPGYRYEWDHLGRLTKVKPPSGGSVIATYTYDPLDRLRLADYGGSTRTRFRYVGLTTSVAQTIDDQSGSVIRHFGNGWTGERLLDWTGAGSNIRIYGTNAHHDTTWTASTSGTVTATLRYDPWGTLTASSGSSLPDHRFQGSWYDTTTEISWVVTRWYAPALGRFLSEDSLLGEPIEPDSRHLYAYAEGEPIANWDPDGRYWYRVPWDDEVENIAKRRLGYFNVWPMIWHANRTKFGRKPSKTSQVAEDTCLWIPIEWLWPKARQARWDNPSSSCRGVRTSRPLADADSARMNVAQDVGDLAAQHGYLFSFTRAKLYARTDAKVRRPRGPTPDQWKVIKQRVNPFNSRAREHIHAGDTVTEGPNDVWVVKGNDAPWYCLDDVCTVGQYIMINGNNVFGRQHKAHEYIHILQYEGRGQEFEDSYLGHWALRGSGPNNPEEALGYAWEYWTWMFEPQHEQLPWNVWLRPPA